MIPIVGMLAGLGGALVGRFLSGLSTGNAFFGSLVAVTGDAHQVQVAQDIFRADVRHETSLLVREDMRDVYALMCEAVALQLTMASICLGVCFDVLISGYPEQGPSLAVELWALCTWWSILFALTSLLLALWFQMCVQKKVREKLFLKHRVFTANDIVVSALGGRNLAEQVGRLHARVVSGLLTLATMGLWDRIRGEGETGGSEASDSNAAHDDPTEHDMGQVASRVRVELVPVSEQCSDCVEIKKLNGGHIVPVCRRARAWYDLKTHSMMRHTLAEIPGFLEGGELVRQPWRIAPDQLKVLRLKVYDEATLYVAGRLEGTEELHPDDEKNKSWTSVCQLNPGYMSWAEDEMPRVVRGGHRACSYFRQVEGFSIFVNCHQMQLPIYKLVLQPPNDDGEPVDVEIRWRFKSVVEALTVIAREGSVLGPEDDYPKKAFLQELEVLAPLMIFSGGYLYTGSSCLMLAVLALHSARVCPVRPWPQCLGEVLAILAAASIMFVGIWSRVFMDRDGPRLYSLHAEDTTEVVYQHRVREQGFTPKQNKPYWRRCASALQRSWRRPTCSEGSPIDDASPSNTSMSKNTARKKGVTLKTTVSDIVSAKLLKQSLQTRRNLVAGSSVLGILFISSLGTCIVKFAIERAGHGVLLEAAQSVDAAPSWPWRTWPAAWPPLFQPTAAAFGADGKTLWLTSSFQLVALKYSAATHQAQTVGAPLRLPTAASGLCFVCGKLLVVGGDATFHVLDPGAVAVAAASVSASSGRLAPGLAAQLAPVLAVAAGGLPGELQRGAGAAAFAGVLEARLWGQPAAAAAGAVPGAGVLAAALPREADAGEAGGVVLYDVSGLGVAGPLSMQPLARIRPRWPAAAAGLDRPIVAMHLCVVGACAAAEPRLWVALSGEGSSLLAVGMDSGEVLSVPHPWPSGGTRRLVALTGNATHLLAISNSIVDEVRSMPEARAARYADLVKGAVGEL